METGMMSPADVKALCGDNNGLFGGFGGGGIFILLFLIIFMFGGGGFGFGRGNAATAQDIQRSVDMSTVLQGQSAIAADVQRTTYELMGAVRDNAYNNLSEIRDVQAIVGNGIYGTQAQIASGFAAMQKCCCDLDKTILENRYLDAQNASAIMANDTANTQKVLDALTQNRFAEMQNQINALQLQNALCGVVKYPQASTYCSGNNPFCCGGC